MSAKLLYVAPLDYVLLYIPTLKAITCGSGEDGFLPFMGMTVMLVMIKTSVHTTPGGDMRKLATFSPIALKMQSHENIDR